MITVLAGVNGAGKSSIGGSAIRAAGGQYFNPDEESRSLLLARPELTLDEASGLVWRHGVERLQQSISGNTNWVFETTLGGRTITRLLLQAAAQDRKVRIWYCGLESPEKHIERVRARVARGGHDIPEHQIRYRYVASLKNLCRLAPCVEHLAVYDNSRDLDPSGRPSPRLLLKAEQGRIIALANNLPPWARSIAGAFVPPDTP